MMEGKQEKNKWIDENETWLIKKDGELKEGLRPTSQNWQKCGWEDLIYKESEETTPNVIVTVKTITRALNDLWEATKYYNDSFNMENLQTPGVYKENSEQELYTIVIDCEHLHKKPIKRRLKELNRRFGRHLALATPDEDFQNLTKTEKTEEKKNLRTI